MFCPACGSPLTTRINGQHNVTAYCAAGDWELPPAVTSLLKRRYDPSQVNDDAYLSGPASATQARGLSRWYCLGCGARLPKGLQCADCGKRMGSLLYHLTEVGGINTHGPSPGPYRHRSAWSRRCLA